MSDPIEKYIENLIERLENARKTEGESYDELEQLSKIIDKGEPAVRDDFIKLFRLVRDKIDERQQTEDEILELFLNNNVIEIKNPQLRQRLSALQREIREAYKKRPHERWLSEGFLSEDEWNYWIAEISYKIHDRPWSDLLYQILSFVDPKEFGDRGFELTTLILTDNIPLQYHKLLTDVEMSYKFGLYNSVFICCRSVIELGIKKYYEDINDMEFNRAKQNNKEIKLEYLIDSLKGKVFFNTRDINKAHFVRKIANGILHSGKTVRQNDAFKGIKNTHFVIKRLFSNDYMKK